MSSIWIVHRDAEARAALTRLAAAPEETLLGSPRDPIFDLSGGAQAVVLGLAGDDIEVELEFAHRNAQRLEGARWIVVADGVDAAPLRALFDRVPLTVLPWPPHADALRAALGESLAGRSDEPLSQRRYRDRLQMRFARWFADLDLPPLLRAVDPANASVPLLVRGELGTGRELVARYVHSFSAAASAGTRSGPFVALACDERTDEADLLEQVDAAFPDARARVGACTLWLDELDRLPAHAQRAVQSWIEFGVPRGRLLGARVRFAASVGDGPPRSRPALAPGLLAAFGGLGLRIPPLRERTHAIDALATDILRSATADSDHVRALSPGALAILRTHPWPENLRELEAVLLRTLASCEADPIEGHHLCFEPLSPVAASAPEERRNGERRRDDTDAAGSGGLPDFERTLPSELRTGLGGAQRDDWPAESGGEDWIDLETVGPSEPIYLDDPDAALDETFAHALPRAESGEADAGRGDARTRHDDPVDPSDRPFGRDTDTAFPRPLRDTRTGGAGPGAHTAFAQEPTERGGAPPGQDDEREAFAGAPSTASPNDDVAPTWSRLLRALSHELRNPLVSARTLVELLPDHHDDPEFRERMSDLVGSDVRRVEQLMRKLEDALATPAGTAEDVNLSDVFASLLEERRATVQERRLLVLRELEQSKPVARVDPRRLRAALETLIDLALGRVQERGDVYFATRHLPTGLRGGPAVRLLIRFSRSGAGRRASDRALGALAEAEEALRETAETEGGFDLSLAELAIRSMGGHFALDAARATETVILADLPAPPPGR